MGTWVEREHTVGTQFDFKCEVGWAWELLSRLETPVQILGLKLGGKKERMICG